MFNKTVLTRSSSCADAITVDPINGTAAVLYKNGSVYSYKNVSRRAIVNFMINECASLGFFVNNILRDSRVSFQQIWSILITQHWLIVIKQHCLILIS